MKNVSLGFINTGTTFCQEKTPQARGRVCFPQFDLKSHHRRGKHRPTLLFSLLSLHIPRPLLEKCRWQNGATATLQLLKVSKWWESSSVKLEQRPRWAVTNISFDIHLYEFLCKYSVLLAARSYLGDRVKQRMCWYQWDGTSTGGINWAEEGIVRKHGELSPRAL